MQPQATVRESKKQNEHSTLARHNDGHLPRGPHSHCGGFRRQDIGNPLSRQSAATGRDAFRGGLFRSGVGCRSHYLRKPRSRQCAAIGQDSCCGRLFRPGVGVGLKSLKNIGLRPRPLPSNTAMETHGRNSPAAQRSGSVKLSNSRPEPSATSVLIFSRPTLAPRLMNFVFCRQSQTRQQGSSAKSVCPRRFPAGMENDDAACGGCRQ